MMFTIYFQYLSHLSQGFQKELIMEVKLYFRMLQRSWWIIILTALSAAMTALIVAYFAAPMYQAKTKYIITPNPSALGFESDLIYSLDTLDRRSVVATYAEILNGTSIFFEVLAEVGVDPMYAGSYSHSAVVLPDTSIIELSVQGPDPVLVAELANETGRKTVQLVERLYAVYDMTLLDPAIPPLAPVSPQPLRDTGIAIVVGLVLGVGLALVRELIRAPIVQFMEDRKLDPESLALSRSEFEKRLDYLALGSVTDLSLCIVHLDGLMDFIKVLPLPTVEDILRHVTKVLKNQLRGNDLVGRWNEADFIVLLSETRGAAAMNTMERVRMALSAPIRIDVSSEDLILHPKIGIAEYRVGDTSQSLLENTNWALELAKNSAGIYLMRATEPL
jgi:diguanylate cyclase (GGDEF)-like protein